MRGIILAACVAASPAAAAPTCEQVGEIARIVAETMQALNAPVIEIAEVVAADYTAGGSEDVFNTVMPNATEIRSSLAEQSERLMAVFSETGCAP